ncbi:hypothetical protein LguiB_013735 [Lonicera macranthoides]
MRLGALGLCSMYSNAYSHDSVDTKQVLRGWNLVMMVVKRWLCSDVFSYGLIILRLIAKRVDLKEDVVKFKYNTLDEWVYKAYKPQRSLVHAGLMKDKDYNESDAIALTELVMRCIEVDNLEARTTMSEVVNGLKNLSSFQFLGDELR